MAFCFYHFYRTFFISALTLTMYRLWADGKLNNVRLYMSQSFSYLSGNALFQENTQMRLNDLLLFC